MNKTKLSQRLSARTQFKSLLVLTLLAGHASAQQATMPCVTLEMPTLSPVECAVAPPKLDLSMPPTLDMAAPSLVQLPSIATLPNTTYATKTGATTDSTWTLRQHATWLLGLKPRHVTSNSIEPSLPEVPHVDILSVAESLPQVPDLSEVPQVPADLVMPADAVLPADAVMLVQHNEPAAMPNLGNLSTEPMAVTTAIHAQEDTHNVAHAHKPMPKRLNTSPVITGPAPALSTDKWTNESLMQVDVSGVDIAKLSSEPAQAESLIDGLSLPSPGALPMPAAPSMHGFTMRDNDSASVAASPSRSKPVSIHEGFAPRVSAANQAAHLTLADSDAAEPGDRLRVSVPTAQKFSLSDKPEKADKADSAKSGPIINRLSDSPAVHDKQDKKAPSKKDVASKPAVEKSFSDKDPIMSSLPVEVSADSDKTSRAVKPLVLTPPARLGKDTPMALPLSTAMPIASTGVGADTLTKPTKSSEEKTKNSLGNKPSAPIPSLESIAADKKSSDSLLDGLTVPPGLLGSTGSIPDSKAPEAKATVSKADTVAQQASTKPVSSGVLSKAEPTKPAQVAKQTNTKPASTGKPAEKLSFSDTNPIALKRPVVKATNVAIPEVVDDGSSVIQSSHEMDDTTRQVAEYAKTAAKLQQAVKQKFPTMRVKISCNEDGLIVEGNVANNVEASKVLSFVRKTSLCPVADRITTSQ